MNSELLRGKVRGELLRIGLAKKCVPLINLRKGFCTPYRKRYLDRDAEWIELWRVYENDTVRHRDTEIVYDQELGRYGVAQDGIFLGHCRDLLDALWECDFNSDRD